MDEKIITLAKKLVEKRLANSYEEALILAEKFVKIDMKYDYDTSFIEDKEEKKENINEFEEETEKKESEEETYIIGESERENLTTAVEGIKTIKLYENIKLIKKTYGFNNTREILGETTITKSINETLEKKFEEKTEKKEAQEKKEELKSNINKEENQEKNVEDPKKRLYNSVDINSFFNVNNLKGKEIPKGK